MKGWLLDFMLKNNNEIHVICNICMVCDNIENTCFQLLLHVFLGMKFWYLWSKSQLFYVTEMNKI